MCKCLNNRQEHINKRRIDAHPDAAVAHVVARRPRRRDAARLQSLVKSLSKPHMLHQIIVVRNAPQRNRNYDQYRNSQYAKDPKQII